MSSFLFLSRLCVAVFKYTQTHAQNAKWHSETERRRDKKPSLVFAFFIVLLFLSQFIVIIIIDRRHFMFIGSDYFGNELFFQLDFIMRLL